MIRVRRADPSDLDFLVELANAPEIEPFLAPIRPRDATSIGEEIRYSQAEPEAFGRFVIELDGERAGALGFERWSEHSRIANLGGLAVHPDFRGRRIADEAARAFQRLLFGLGFHRLQLECYGFNERAIRHAERVGFVREGVKRKAYHRHGEWADGVMFGLVLEDLGEGVAFLYEHVSRFNAGVRSGDFAPMLERFADDAEIAFEGVPVGPFRGRESIAAAYREQPPDDEIEVLDARGEAGEVVATYAWRRGDGVAAGKMLLTPRDGRVQRLVITFERS